MLLHIPEETGAPEEQELANGDEGRTGAGAKGITGVESHINLEIRASHGVGEQS